MLKVIINQNDILLCLQSEVFSMPGVFKIFPITIQNSKPVKKSFVIFYILCDPVQIYDIRTVSRKSVLCTVHLDCLYMNTGSGSVPVHYVQYI